MQYLAHLRRRGKQLVFSGYCAEGDLHDGAGVRTIEDRAPNREFVVVDVGAQFILTHDGSLYVLGPGPAHHQVFRPRELVAMAKRRELGLRLLEAVQRELFQ